MSHLVTTQEEINLAIATALKLVHIKTTPEVKHEPVTVAYAAEDLKKNRNTIKAMADRGELKWDGDKIDFQSLHEYKTKNA